MLVLTGNVKYPDINIYAPCIAYSELKAVFISTRVIKDTWVTDIVYIVKGDRIISKR